MKIKKKKGKNNNRIEVPALSEFSFLFRSLLITPFTMVTRWSLCASILTNEKHIFTLVEESRKKHNFFPLYIHTEKVFSSYTTASYSS